MSQEKNQAGQYLTFMLKSEFYAVPISTVREINRVGEITPVPQSPSFVKGVMNLRGKIIPVIHLRLKFGMIEEPFTRDTCIIVIESPIGQVGMIVDAVKEVVDLENQQIEPAPPLGSAEDQRFIRGLGKLEDRVLILVDIVEALTPVHRSQVQELFKAAS